MNKRNDLNLNLCPCGSGNSYKNCCEIAHLDITKVQTAEQLMRSRYTAFTMANGDYLMKSQHTKTRPTSEKKAIENWARSVMWVKLDILQSAYDTVDFNAHFIEDGQQKVIHEHSKFVKENGHWVYYDIV